MNKSKIPIMIEASLFGKKWISEVLFVDQYKNILWHFYEVSEAYYSNKYLNIQGINDHTNMKRYKVYLTLYKGAHSFGRLSIFDI